MEHVLVAGASGVVGQAAVRRLAAAPDTRVTGISRRVPHDAGAARLMPLDLTDAAACDAASAQPGDVTHLVYAALFEQPGLKAGWVDATQIATNTAMLKNVLRSLSRTTTLRHVTLLQGAKAYGPHVRPIPILAREDHDEWRDTPNFYWEQERLIREGAARHGWNWTILRPQVIFGDAIGAAMNPIPALGAWAAVLKEQGLPLAYPGNPGSIGEATDADLLASAIAWAGHTPGPFDEVFDITNGDVFTWRDVWPVIAQALAMEVGPDTPCSLARTMAAHGETWEGSASGTASPHRHSTRSSASRSITWTSCWVSAVPT